MIGVIAAVIGVPPRQKCDVTMAAVSEARLATISVCGDSLPPPPPPGARPFDTGAARAAGERRVRPWTGGACPEGSEPAVRDSARGHERRERRGVEQEALGDDQPVAQRGGRKSV